MECASFFFFLFSFHSHLLLCLLALSLSLSRPFSFFLARALKNSKNFRNSYVSGNGVPRWLRWVPRASFIKHAFEGLVVNEFEGMEFEPESRGAAGKSRGGGGDGKKKQGGPPGAGGAGGGGPGDLLTGEDVLRRFGLAEESVSSTVRAQCRVLAFHCWTTLCLLRARQPKYVSPSSADLEIVGEGESSDGEKKKEK